MALSIVITDRWISNKKRYVSGQLLTNNTTYAAGGLALPTKNSFGFVRQMDTLLLSGQEGGSTTGYLLQYDKTNQKLQFFVSHDTAGATALPMDEEGADATGTRTYTFIATGW